MVTKAQAKILISEEFAIDSKEFKSCMILLNHFYNQPAQVQNYITFNKIKKQIGNDEILLFEVVNFFLKNEIFSIHYEVIFEDEILDVDEDEINEAIRTNFLIHPEDGFEIENAKKYIYPYFGLCVEKENL